MNFQRFMNLTINSHRNPYFEEAFVTVGALWHPYSQASKKIKRKHGDGMARLISLFFIGNPSYCFLKKAY